MKKVISIALALLMVAVMLPVMAAAADTEITTEAELRSKVSTMAAGDNVTVRLKEDVAINGDLKVSTGTLTILGQGNKLTMKSGSMVISNGATVNLGTKEGAGDPENALILTSTDMTTAVINMGGSAVLNMYRGVAIKDSFTWGQAGGVQLIGENTVFNMYGGVIDNCVNGASVAGGVCIDGGALFNMHDGVIQNCSGWTGGAVSVSGGPVIGEYLSGSTGFHMYGGTIKDCYDNWYFDPEYPYEEWYCGGAVCVSSDEPVSFIMDGGTITGCRADGGGYGGAIFVNAKNAGAVIKINKGEITGNKGTYGGGIYVKKGNVEIADGVALHNNTATEEGDDLYNESGSVTLGKLPAGLKLASSGRDIDGWYHDKKDARWSCEDADQMKKHTEAAFTDGRALKAAHGEAPAAEPPLIIFVPEAPEQEAPNPTTGSRDLAGVAVAMAAVSLLGAAAVIRKK